MRTEVLTSTRPVVEMPAAAEVVLSLVAPTARAVAEVDSPDRHEEDAAVPHVVVVPRLVPSSRHTTPGMTR